MKLQKIIIWNDEFWSQEFTSSKLKAAIDWVSNSILGLADSEQKVISTSIQVLEQALSKPDLTIEERVTVACLETRTNIQLIFDTEIKRIDPKVLANLDSEVMIAHLHDTIWAEELEKNTKNLFASIFKEVQADEVELVLEMLGELNYKQLSFEDLNSICDLVDEYDLHEDILDFLKTHGIEAYRFHCYWDSPTKIILRKNSSNTESNIHLQNQVTITLKKVLVSWKLPTSWVEYFSWITFSEEPCLLLFRDWKCTLVQIVEDELVNDIPVWFIEEVENIDWDNRSEGDNLANHIYMEKSNEITPLGFVDYAMWTVSGVLDEDDPEYKASMEEEGKQHILLFFNRDRKNYLTFDGTSFGTMKQLKWEWNSLSETQTILH